MINLDRMRAAVRGSIALLAPSGVLPVWGMQQWPARVGSEQAIVTARLVRGPTLRPPEVVQVDEPTEIRWQLLDDTAGVRVGLAVCGARFWIDTAVAASIEESRDAFLERLTGMAQTRDALPGVSIDADGTDAIVFDASDVPGLLFHPVMIGPSAVVDMDVTETVTAESQRSGASMVVELQAFVAGGGPEAAALLADINGGMALDAALALRHDLGVVFNSADEPVDLTTLAGAGWQSRASTRWTLSMVSYKSRAIDTIETVEIGLIAYDGSTPIEIPAEVESP